MHQSHFFTLDLAGIVKRVFDDPFGTFRGNDCTALSRDGFFVYLDEMFDACVKALGIFSNRH